MSAPTKASEPKMPEPVWSDELDRPRIVYTEVDMETIIAAWQAYAAGIRAEVLAEVRVVMPEKISESAALDKSERGVVFGWNGCCEATTKSLATLENPNE